MLHDAPAEVQINEISLRGLLLRHAHIGRYILRLRIEVLHQQTTAHAYILLLGRVVLRHIDLDEAQVLLRREHLQSTLLELRSHDNLQEDGLHQLGSLLRQGTVYGHNTTENRHLIGLVSLRPSLYDILTDGGTAGVHVLQTDAERLIELAHDGQSGVGILDIVVRKLLAVQLLGRSERERNGLLLGIEHRLLVGVLTVAQRLLEVELQEELLVQAGLLAHVGSDHRIVLSRVGVGLGRELQTALLLRVAELLDLGQNLVVILGVANHRYIVPVLGSRTQHRRTADIDILNGLLDRYALLLNRLTEGIEVHAHQVDKLDSVLLQRLKMALVIAASQQTAMHLGVQRLHAAVANLGEARYVADVDYLHAALLEQLHRAARGDHLPAQRAEALGKLHHATLVAYTN